MFEGKFGENDCRENLSLKKSVLNNHIKSSKHEMGKKRLAAKEKRERSISDMLKSYDKDVHPVGENLPENVRIFRVKILTAFMSTGVA